MQEITREDIGVLVKLQKAETETVRIESFLKKIETEKIGVEKELIAFKSALENHKDELAKAAALCRDTEAEVQMLGERVVRSNEKLRQVKTNKEYQALQREVDDNRKRKEVLETSFIKFLEDKESKETFVSQREVELAQLTEKIRTEQEEIDKKGQSDRELLNQYRRQREEIGEKLESSLYRQFNQISNANGGLAVVEVRERLCRGCFMSIPHQLYIEVQRCNSLILCPQCNRILYFAQPEESTVQAD
ncbi:MAG: C4-type zinc ribbon domain-containing protein [Desulfobacterium sp.]|jgi:predicted  nucleic acid-binding Zn-ribbon protein|nr:C4-type zinc ribbon domain-containing protein [Desulfobacterium sp.]